MTKKLAAELAVMVLLSVTACLMVPYFEDPDLKVVIPAVIAWAALIVAICKVRFPGAKG